MNHNNNSKSTQLSSSSSEANLPAPLQALEESLLSKETEIQTVKKSVDEELRVQTSNEIMEKHSRKRHLSLELKPCKSKLSEQPQLIGFEGLNSKEEEQSFEKFSFSFAEDVDYYDNAVIHLSALFQCLLYEEVMAMEFNSGGEPSMASMEYNEDLEKKIFSKTAQCFAKDFVNEVITDHRKKLENKRNHIAKYCEDVLQDKCFSIDYKKHKSQLRVLNIINDNHYTHSVWSIALLISEVTLKTVQGNTRPKSVSMPPLQQTIDIDNLLLDIQLEEAVPFSRMKVLTKVLQCQQKLNNSKNILKEYLVSSFENLQSNV